MTVRERVLDGIAWVPAAASRRPKRVLVAALVVSLLMVQGVALLHVNDDVSSILPRSDPNTLAALNVSRAFPTNYDITDIILVVDPHKWAKAEALLPNRVTQGNASNITDEVYLRGMYAFERFFLDHVPSARYNISLEAFVRFTNYTNTAACANTGPNVPGAAPETTCATAFDPASFKRLPPTTPRGEAQFAEDWQTVYHASPQAVAALVGPRWNATSITFLFDPAPGETSQQVGAEVIAGWRAYEAWVPNHPAADVFDLHHSVVDSRAPTVLDAHTSAVTSQDLQLLAPLVLLFILGSLWVAFRDLRVLGVAGGTLLLGTLWSFGAMGYLGLPLNTVNLSLVPLVLGNGIDYAIHVSDAFLEASGSGLDPPAAFRRAGRRAGVALAIASTTTVAGLLVMTLSPSVLMAQVGLVSALGMVLLLVLALTVLPAALTLAGVAARPHRNPTSRLVPRLGRGVAKHPAVVLLVLLALTGATLAAARALPVATYGDPAADFPPGDWARSAQRDANVYLYGSSHPSTYWAANELIFQGDVTDPAFHSYLRNLTADLQAQPYIEPASVVGITYLIQQWEELKGGTAGVVVPLARSNAQPGSTYPTTRQGIQRDLDEIFSSPMRTLGSPFITYPKENITITALDLRQGQSYSQTSTVWHDLWDLLNRDATAYHKPQDVTVHLAGFTATSYLFVRDELPWVTTMSVVAFGVVLALVAFFTRSPRAILAVGALMLLTTAWWLGILSFLHIGLSIAMMLPLIFILSIGSDYAVHLTWNLEHDDATGHHVLATTGKSVLFSALTDGGAFAIFAAMRYLLMRGAMVATSLAIVTIFAATMLVVPLVYRRRVLAGWPEGGEEAGQASRAGLPDASPEAR